MVQLLSPDGKYDALYLRNYANIKVKDELARLPGVGQVQIFGSGDYAMRIRLNPDKIASRGMTAGDVVRAVQRAKHPGLGRTTWRRTDRERHRLPHLDQCSRPPAYGLGVRQRRAEDRGRRRGGRLSDVARIELGANDYTLRGQLDNQDAPPIGIFQAPGAKP